jgi:trimeric autotransporter adhesin
MSTTTTSKSSSKKRRDEVQLTKDDYNKNNETDDNDRNMSEHDTMAYHAQPFQRASADVLAQRRIVRASKPHPYDTITTTTTTSTIVQSVSDTKTDTNNTNSNINDIKTSTTTTTTINNELPSVSHNPFANISLVVTDKNNNSSNMNNTNSSKVDTNNNDIKTTATTTTTKNQLAPSTSQNPFANVSLVVTDTCSSNNNNNINNKSRKEDIMNPNEITDVTSTTEVKTETQPSTTISSTASTTKDVVDSTTPTPTPTPTSTNGDTTTASTNNGTTTIKETKIFGSSLPFSGFHAVNNKTSIPFGSSSNSSPSSNTVFGSNSSSSNTGGFGSHTTNIQNSNGFNEAFGVNNSKSYFSSFAGNTGSIGFGSGFGSTNMLQPSLDTIGTKGNETTNDVSLSTSSTMNDDKDTPISDIVVVSGTDGTPADNILPEHYELKSGEEDENCLLELRCRTWRLGTTTTNNNTTTSSTTSSAFTGDHSHDRTSITTGIVPSSSFASVPTSLKSEIITANTNSKNDVHNTEKTSDDSSSTQANHSSVNEGTKKWIEVGCGPIRVLQRRQQQQEEEDNDHGSDAPASSNKSSCRLVQRRESTPGGNATIVILNVRLTTVTIQATTSEVHVQIVTVASTNIPETYLFKFKHFNEAKRFKNCLQQIVKEQG